MCANPDFIFTVHDEPPQDAVTAVDVGLGATNAAAAPLDNVRPLACVVRRPTGEIAGVAIGRTWGHCCEIQQVWVEAAYRRQGVATRLISELHHRATERGCRTFYLETFSFQAPSLYQSLGYDVRLKISGFGEGVFKFVMVRELPDSARS